MKSNEFAETLNRKYFGIEVNRFQKIVSGLRQHQYCNRSLFADGRTGAIATAEQTAYLIYVAALNLNPFGNDFNREIPRVYTLKDEQGKYFVDVLTDYLNHPEKIDEDGLCRISFSQDRPSIVFVFKPPFFKEALSLHPNVTNFVVKETDQIFGERGEMPLERFSIVKQSALKEISMLLNNEVSINQ